MDWNNDGVTDLVAGDTKGNVWFFENTGEKERPVLARGVRVKAGGKVIAAQRKTYKRVKGKTVLGKPVGGSHELAQIYSKLHVADWNGDGLKDLLVGHSSTIIFYRNVGTAEKPKLEDPVLIEPGGGRWPNRPSPYVVDWDGDGTQDLLVGSEGRGEVFFYRNLGSNRKPKLGTGDKLRLRGDGVGDGYRCRIGVTDWNNDGKLDLLVGNFFSGRGRKSGGNVWLFLGE